MCRRFLAFGLALGLLLGPSLAWSAPPPSSPSVSLSPSESAQIEAALTEAKAALERSNREIATQSKILMRLSILCGVLAVALVAEGVATAKLAFK